jgi:hypothetical protein
MHNEIETRPAAFTLQQHLQSRTQIVMASLPNPLSFHAAGEMTTVEQVQLLPQKPWAAHVKLTATAFRISGFRISGLDFIMQAR